MQKILYEDLPVISEFRSEVGDALVNIVRKGMAKDRDQRYRVDHDLASDLSRAFGSLLGEL